MPLKSWRRGVFSGTRRQRRGIDPPRPEGLERRVLLSTVTWIGGSGSWGAAANWQDDLLAHRLPGPADEVVIDQAGASVAHVAGSDTIASLTGNNPLTLSGGSLTIGGSLRMSNGNRLTLAGGRLAGARVAEGTTIVGTGSGGTLDGVTLDGTFDMSDPGVRSVTVVNGLTVNGSLLVGKASSSGGDFGTVYLSGSQTIGGTGQVVFGANPRNVLQPSVQDATLTFGSGLRIRGGSGIVDPAGYRATFVNQGTVQADVAGGQISVNLGNAGRNEGTIKALNGAVLTVTGTGWTNAGTLAETFSALVLGGTYTTVGLGHIVRVGGLVNLEGTLNNTGATLALDDTSGSWNLTRTTILGGTIATTGSARLYSAYPAGATLDGVTIAAGATVVTAADGFGPLSVRNGLRLDGTIVVGDPVAGAHYGFVTFLGSQTIDGSGQILMGTRGVDTLTTDDGGTTTLGPALTVRGKVGNLVANGATSRFVVRGTVLADVPGGQISVDLGNGGRIEGTGTVKALNGATLNLTGTGWTNAGTLAETSSTLNLGGTFTTTGLGFVDALGGAVRFTGTLTNNVPLVLDGAGAGQYFLAGGTIKGGRILTPNGGSLVAFGVANTLDGVTLAGTIVLGNTVGASMAMVHGLTLDGGTIRKFGTGTLNVSGSQTLGGTGTVDFADNVAGGGLVVPVASDTLTIDIGVSIGGFGGRVGSIGAIHNLGTIAADLSGEIVVYGLTNIVGGTLTGGIYRASDGGILRLRGTSIVTLAADLTLDGAGSRIYGDVLNISALTNLAAVSAGGRLTLRGGALLATAALSNAGAVVVDGTGALRPTSYTQTSGSTTLSGDGGLGPAAPAAPISVLIQGGTVLGNGRLDANVTNAGTVAPGMPLGRLFIRGTYTQTATGVLDLEVGGSTLGLDFDRLDVTSTAALGGTLRVSLVNGFGPHKGQIFDVVAAAAVSGEFATRILPQNAGQPVFLTLADATMYHLVSQTSAPDLAVQSITAPALGGPGQSATITYIVTNHGTVPATGSWTDSVYLSTDMTLSADDLLLGRVVHSGDLTYGRTYQGTLTAPLPGVSDGTYRVLVVADSRLEVSDEDRGNNVAVAAAALPVRAPTLAVGSVVTGTLASGQDVYYRVNVAPGSSVQLSADFGVASEAELLIRYGASPSLSDYDLSADGPTGLHAVIPLPAGIGGPYYVRLHGLAGAGAGRPFTLHAESSPFEVTAIDSTSGGNQGSQTVRVTGSGFTASTTATLRGSTSERGASLIAFVDTNHLVATFDLNGLTPGSYMVELTEGLQNAAAAIPFLVIGGPSAPFLSTLVIVQSQSRVGLPIVANFRITNYGDNDAQLPTYLFAASRSAPESAYFPSVLLPGHSFVEFGSIFVPSPSGNHFIHEYKLGTIPNSAQIDWSLVRESSRPPTIPAGVWAVIWANFSAAVKLTAGELDATLQADSAYFARLGTPVTDTATLLNFELQKASAIGPVPTLGGAVDLSVSEPGPSLTFARTFVQSIAGRNAPGSLGLGWVSNWDIAATSDPVKGNIFLQQGPLTRLFLRQRDGSYRGTGSDHAALVFVGDHLTLRELDGTLTTFLPNGRLKSVEDPNGNRITASYTGTQMTSLKHSNGDRMTLAYDTSDRLIRVTDPFGRSVAYNYDASGQHLLDAATSRGLYAYGYVTGQGAARQNALASIAFPDGNQLAMSYDVQGRLTRMDDGSNPLTFAPLTTGGYTVTDGAGATSTILLGVSGQPVSLRDPSGNIRTIRYTSEGKPDLVTAPDGASSAIRYDAAGNPVGVLDTLGNATRSTYDPQFNRLSSFQDALGSTTSFAYDARGNPAAISYADGRGPTYQVDAQGQFTEAGNARGQAAHYVYNGRGQIIEADYVDGVTTFTYDAHGNLHTAADAGGTTTLTYDAADRLTGVSYPEGTSLGYTYDAGGRKTRTVDQSGFATNYAYDAAGRLARITDGSGALVAAYLYDAAGRLAEKDLGNGTYTTYSYFPIGTVQSIVNRAARPSPSIDGPTNSRFDYTYDVNGRVRTQTTTTGTTTYAYDDAGRLTTAALPGGRTLTYAYDVAGNRTLVGDGGTSTVYVANGLNQYTSAGAGTFTFDADGNLTARSGPGGTTTYAYDSRGRLTGVTTPTDSWAYRYDALGNRVATTHNGQTNSYLVDPTGLGTVLGEYDGAGNLVAHYTDGLGLTSRVDASGNASYYDYDAVGSTAGLTGAGGAYLATYSYLPFGELGASTGSLANPFQYVGQFGVMGEGNGLDFMRARFYAPADGRFISRDPIGLLGGTNPYAYSNNDPTNRIDPTGLQFFTPEEERIIAEQTARALADSKKLAETLGQNGQLNRAARENVGILTTIGTLATSASGAVTAWLGSVSVTVGFPALGLASQTIGGTGSALAGAGIVGGVVALAVIDVVILGAIAYETYLLIPEVISYYWPVVVTSDDIAASGSTEEIGPEDPNFLSGPAGFGPENFVPVEVNFPYRIDFENIPTASAPALVVRVVQTLDPNLDWSTFALTSFGFGEYHVDVPAGRQRYATRVDATATLGYFVDVAADLNLATGVATWTFTTIDPTTLDVPLGDPLAGFLPPDDDLRRGEGWVAYTIRPKATAPTGTVIDALATVIFDAGLPGESHLDTPPFFNTLDAGPPSSRVEDLPAVSPGPFFVTWSGSDEAGGSGVASYDVYVSADGGPFELWQRNTSATGAKYDGSNGHTYAFYSVATDHVGHRERADAVVLAETRVVTVTDTTSAVGSSQPSSTYGDALTFTATVSASDPAFGIPTGTIQFSIDGDPFGPAVVLVNGAATSAAIATLGSGTHLITAAYSGDPSHGSSAGSAGQDVAKAGLTVRADDAGKLYGAANPAFSATFTGFVPGEGPGELGGTLVLSAEATAASHVGLYPINASGLTSGNYAITFATGTLAVTPAPLVIAADNRSRPYGQANPVLTADYIGFVNGDGPANLATPAILSTSAWASSSVGGYPIAVSGASSADYAITQVDGTLTVAKAHLRVTAEDKSRDRGQANPTLTYAIAGFVNGDGPSVVIGSASLGTAATAASPAGAYAITPTVGTLRAANYDFDAFIPGILLVRPTVIDIRVRWGSRSASVLPSALGGRLDLPWDNLTAIDVIFSDDVAVDAAALALKGTVGRTYGFSGFRYDPVTRDATWTLPTALGVDRLMLSLDGDDAASDGHNGVRVGRAYLGAYGLGLAVLPGDFNGDGAVDSSDLVGVRNQMQGTGDPAMAIWADMDGNGIVDINDYNAVRKKVGTRLPRP
ncbi:MAG: repeat-associated core domain protein [Planctomycetota bacterium]|nr:repeat-associated core domain protein [Planctomycetota bacterium]